MSNLINGTNFNRNMNEYQYFPEEYYSGSDVTVYFDDVHVDDIMEVRFALGEKVLPIYGYNSFTPDRFGRGQRVVQGSFTVAFKEAGYVDRILSHIGLQKTNSKPFLAYAMNQQQRPQWVAYATETIEQLMERAYGSTQTESLKSVEEWSDFGLGTTDPQVTELQNLILTDGSRYKGLSDVPAINLTQDMKRTASSGYISSGSDVRLLKERLNYYLYDGITPLISKRLNNSSNVFDAETEAAVKVFQRTFSRILAVDGVVGEQTRGILNRGLRAYGTFDAPTKLAIMRFQKANNLSQTGEINQYVRQKLSITTIVASNPQTGTAAETQFAHYEDRIWDEQTTYNPDYRHQPFFYGKENQQALLDNGFDIYIVYGEMPEYFTHNKASLTPNGAVNFGTTVKAIRGIHITSVSQVLSPTGEPIAEQYQFIARDLD